MKNYQRDFIDRIDALPKMSHLAVEDIAATEDGLFSIPLIRAFDEYPPKRGEVYLEVAESNAELSIVAVNFVEFGLEEILDAYRFSILCCTNPVLFELSDLEQKYLPVLLKQFSDYMPAFFQHRSFKKKIILCEEGSDRISNDQDIFLPIPQEFYHLSPRECGYKVLALVARALELN